MTEEKGEVERLCDQAELILKRAQELIYHAFDIGTRRSAAPRPAHYVPLPRGMERDEIVRAITALVDTAIENGEMRQAACERSAAGLRADYRAYKAKEADFLVDTLDDWLEMKLKP